MPNTNQNENAMTDIKVTSQELFERLLNAYQHTVTQEQLSRTEVTLVHDIDKLDTKLEKSIDGVNAKIDKVEASLKEDISKVDAKIEKIGSSISRFQWTLMGSVVFLAFKEYIFALFQ